MTLNWDYPIQNGFDAFFTEESYKKYSREESFEERFMRHLESWEARSSGNVLKQNAIKEKTENKRTDKSENQGSAYGEHSTSIKIKSEHDDKNTQENKVTVGVCHGKGGTAQQPTERPYSQQYGPTRRATFVAKARVPPPRYSSLKHEEQRQYLYLYQKYYMSKPVNPTEEEIAELNKLNSLQKLVVNEQKEHQEYAKKLAQAQCTNYTYMHPEVKKYIEEKLKYKKKEIELYPFHYNTVSQFVLAGTGSNPQLLYMKKLLELGNIPRMVIPTVSLSNRQQMNLNAGAIEEHYPSVPSKGNCNKWNHEVCSLDINAESLAKVHHAHVVISPGALMCLVDNYAPHYTRDWEIPVTVKDYTLNDGDKIVPHRTVYIDRPVISKHITEREKNTKFYKFALKKHFKSHSERNANIGQGYSKTVEGEITSKTVTKKSPEQANKNTFSKSNKEEKLEAVGDLFGSNDCMIDDLETFGMTSFEKDLSSKIKSKQQTDSVSTNDHLEGQSIDSLEESGAEAHKSLSADSWKVTMKRDSSVWRKPQKIDFKSGVEDVKSEQALMKDSSESRALLKSLSQDSQGFEPAVDFEDQSGLTVSAESNEMSHKQERSASEQLFDNEPDKEKEITKKTEINQVGIDVQKLLDMKVLDGDRSLTNSRCLFRNIETPTSPLRDLETPASPTGDLESPASPTGDLETPASPTRYLESPASPTGDVETPASPTGDLEIPASRTGDLETPASPIGDLESPASPIGDLETPVSPTATPSSPQIMPLCINTSPEHSVLDTPISPEKNGGTFCSPDARPCKIIPLQGEDETEIVIDNSQCYVPSLDLSSAIRTGTPGRRAKTRKSCDISPELKVKDKKKRTTRQSIIKLSDLDTDDDEENLVIDWSSQEESKPEMSCKELDTSTEKRKAKKHGKTKTDETDQKDLQIGKDAVKFEKQKNILDSDVTPSSTRVTRSGSRLSLDSLIDLHKKPPKRKLRSNTQDSENSDCHPNSSSSEQQEGRITRSKGRRSNEIEPFMENTEKKTRSSTKTTVPSSDCSPFEDKGHCLLTEEELKSDQISQDSESVCSEESLLVRRKRGHPRKLSIEDENSNPSADIGVIQMDLCDQRVDENKTEDVQVEPTQPKRRRGRPPKVKKDGDNCKDVEEAKGVSEETEKTQLTMHSHHDRDETLPSAQREISAKSKVTRNQESIGHDEISFKNKGAPEASSHTVRKQGRKTSGVSTLDAIMQLQEKMLDVPGQGVIGSTPEPAAELASPATQFQYSKPDHHSNVSYHLWSLGGFQIIIRCGYHGIVKDHLQQLSHVHICPKMEYQSSMGLEQLSQSEVSRSWISAYIRPNCKLLRARVDPVKSEFMSVEQVNPAQMVSSTQVFNPGSTMLMLQNVFHKLHQLQPGQYLLSHSKGSKECQIRKSTENNKRGTYDLHFQHFGFMATERKNSNSEVPWIPIDPTIIMPHHIKYGRIPATFQPKDYSFHPGGTHVQKKNKKRKKKNKKINKQNSS